MKYIHTYIYALRASTVRTVVDLSQENETQRKKKKKKKAKGIMTDVESNNNTNNKSRTNASSRKQQQQQQQKRKQKQQNNDGVVIENPYNNSTSNPHILPTYHPLNILRRILYMCISLYGLNHYDVYHTIMHSSHVKHEWFKIGLASTIGTFYVCVCTCVCVCVCVCEYEHRLYKVHRVYREIINIS